MAAVVNPSFPTPDLSQITTGAGVRGRTWIDTAMLANYLRGRGRQLVPFFAPNVSIPSGSTYVFRFRVKTGGAARRRVWQIHHANSSAFRLGQITVKAPASSGGAATFPVTPSLGTIGTFSEYLEDYTGSGVESEITLEITVNSADAIDIYGISCTELPRGLLNLDSTDLGTDVNTETAREPIISEGNRAINGIVSVLSSTAAGRRAGLLYLAKDTTVPLTEAAGVDTRIFALDQSIVGRRIKYTDTTATASWRVYCKTDVNGTTGQVTVLNNRTSTTTTISIPTGSHTGWAWFPSTAGAASTFSIDCEDAASTDGRQTSGTPAWGDLTFKFKRGASGTLSLAGVSVWED